MSTADKSTKWRVPLLVEIRPLTIRIDWDEKTRTAGIVTSGKAKMREVTARVREVGGTISEPKDYWSKQYPGGQAAYITVPETNPRRRNPRLTFINPADIITTEDGYFVKKAALRKLQKAIYDNTGEWRELSEVEYIVNKMLAKAAHDKFTIVHGKHFKQANPRRKHGF